MRSASLPLPVLRERELRAPALIFAPALDAPPPAGENGWAIPSFTYGANRLNPPRSRIVRRSRALPCVTALLALPLLCLTARAADTPAFEFKDGDKVALVGNTFFEREQTYSYLETLLVTRFPDRNIAFRNLGWSGDTVFGTARAYFE